MKQRTQNKHFRKYDFSATRTPEMLSEDMQTLGKLVGTYGVKTIIAAAPHCKARRPGRPSEGHLPMYEKISDADWIDERVEYHESKGQIAPTRQARIDYFHMKHGHDIAPPNETQLATIKKSHLEGRKLRNFAYRREGR